MSNYNLTSLFHFTDSLDRLISIMKNEFKPRYCLEKIIYGNKVFKYAIPMVCFCDIPLSQIKNHTETYGRYGLGMSKEWAERNGLNPILYLKRTSRIARSLSMTKQNISRLLRAAQDDRTHRSFIYLFRYLKNYEGTFLKGIEHDEPIFFYNEREWRFVPNVSVLREEDYSNYSKREAKNDLLKVVSFDPEDIKYIIVDNEREIGATINAIRKIKKPKYPLAMIDILTSRIITSEQIWNDF